MRIEDDFAVHLVRLDHPQDLGGVAERADAAENQARTVEAQLNRSEEKLEECEQRLSSLVGERDRADRADSLVADLESKLENCKEQHKAAVKVIDDALPAISEYLETISTDAPS